MGLTSAKIEGLIGEEVLLAKAFDRCWTQPTIKRIAASNGIKFGFINTYTGMVYFEVH